MSTWATKYRPTKLDDVLGQEHAAKAIANILNTNQLHPVYMVTGAWGSGKTTILRVFAMALTCPNAHRGEGCGQCQSCRNLIDHQQNDNYAEIDAADHGNVEDVRRLIQNAAVTVTGKARWRVVLIDECHLLSKAAQGALLKLLEEGSRTTIYMLATTDLQKLLPTIASRAIKWQIRSIPRDKIQKRLLDIAARENVQVEPEAAKLIVQQKRGHVRDSIMLLEQVALMGDVTTKAVQEYLELDKDRDTARVLLLLKADTHKAYQYLEEMMAKTTPEALWMSARRILTEAMRARSTEQDHPLQGVLDELNEKYRDHLGNAVEWIMGTQIRPETPTEVICAVAMLQARIAPDTKTSQVLQKRAGVPARFQGRDLSATEEMTVETFISHLNLVEISNGIPPKS